ncbi:hypothetical protein EYF80_016812 [Liparis tanakae]|uniref:Uncharacterized protein n=1 Tax=Liparis tanakae TaxID=230148 RepID=A0A4Z2I6N4_9TELE|nr:hypothetical protein EYF80_016812 [Liparis tanakae]
MDKSVSMLSSCTPLRGGNDPRRVLTSRASFPWAAAQAWISSSSTRDGVSSVWAEVRSPYSLWRKSTHTADRRSVNQLSVQLLLTPCGLTFTPCGLTFTPCGLTFTPCGLTFTPCGLTFTPCGLTFTPCGLTFTPCGLTFTPCGLTFTVGRSRKSKPSEKQQQGEGRHQHGSGGGYF